MSDQDQTENWLKEYASARRKASGSTQMRMPNPMRQRLYDEIVAVESCDPVYERNGSFGLGRLLRILIPVGVVASLSIAGFLMWQSEQAKTAPGALANEAVAHPPAVATAAATPAPAPDNTSSPQQNSSSENTVAVGTFVAAGAVGSGLTRRDFGPVERTITLSTGAPEMPMPGIPQAAPQIQIEPVVITDMVAESMPTLVPPSAPGYGEPREATTLAAAPDAGAVVPQAMQGPAKPKVSSPGAEEPRQDSLRFATALGGGGQILSTFTVSRNGEKITFIDSDGSLYSGQTRPGKEEAKVASADAASVETFTVSGKNETIGRAIQISGSIFENSISIRSGNLGMPQGRTVRVDTMASGEGQRGAVMFENSLSGRPAPPQERTTRIHAVVNVEGQREPVVVEAELAE